MDTAHIRETLEQIVDPVDDKTLIEILARCMITQTHLLCDISDRLKEISLRIAFK